MRDGRIFSKFTEIQIAGSRSNEKTVKRSKQMSGKVKNIDTVLALARKDLLEGRYERAIGIYRGLLDGDAAEKAAGAYSLGIIYESGTGVTEDDAEAEKYYSIAEENGAEMGTYRLARIHLRRKELSQAMKKFKQVARINPSAAYWTYRLLNENQGLIEQEGEKEQYLALAIEQGHVHAKKVEVMERITGRKGLLRIPSGLIDYVRLVFETKNAVTNQDKMRYQ